MKDYSKFLWPRHLGSQTTPLSLATLAELKSNREEFHPSGRPGSQKRRKPHPLCANMPSPSFSFRLPGGCWMMKWQSASPCPASPACSTITAPRRQVSRSPIPLTIASFPFALTTRSHRGWYENSQSLLQGKKSQVRMTPWQRMREMSRQALWRCDTWLLLTQIWFLSRAVHVSLRSPHSLSRLICYCSYPNLSASEVFNHTVGV